MWLYRSAFAFFLSHWIPFSKYICLRCCYAANISGENITWYWRNCFQNLFGGNKTTRDQVFVPDTVLLRRSCIDLLLPFLSLFLLLSSISSSFLSVCHSIPDHHLHLSFLYLLSLFSVCGKWVCVTLSGCPLQVSGDSLYYRGSPSLKEWQRVTETCWNRETRHNMKRESQGEKKRQTWIEMGKEERVGEKRGISGKLRCFTRSGCPLFLSFHFLSSSRHHGANRCFVCMASFSLPFVSLLSPLAQKTFSPNPSPYK